MPQNDANFGIGVLVRCYGKQLHVLHNKGARLRRLHTRIIDLFLIWRIVPSLRFLSAVEAIDDDAGRRLSCIEARNFAGSGQLLTAERLENVCEGGGSSSGDGLPGGG